MHTVYSFSAMAMLFWTRCWRCSDSGATCCNDNLPSQVARLFDINLDKSRVWIVQLLPIACITFYIIQYNTKSSIALKWFQLPDRLPHSKEIKYPFCESLSCRLVFKPSKSRAAARTSPRPDSFVYCVWRKATWPAAGYMISDYFKMTMILFS